MVTGSKGIRKTRFIRKGSVMDPAAAIITGFDRAAYAIVGAMHRLSGFVGGGPDVYPFILAPRETLPLTIAGSGTGMLNFVLPANTTFHLQYFMHQVTSELLTGSIQVDARRVNLMNAQVLIEVFSNTIDVADADERALWKLPIPYTFRGPSNFSIDLTDLSTSENNVKIYAVGIRDNREQANASGTHARSVVDTLNIQPTDIF